MALIVVVLYNAHHQTVLETNAEYSSDVVITVGVGRNTPYYVALQALSVMFLSS